MLDTILIKGLSKHTLNTYFSGMKIDPKCVFLYVFFLICLVRYILSKISQYDQKHTCFFPILLIFAPLNDLNDICVHCLVLKNNPNYVNFFTRMISIFKYQCPPRSILHHELNFWRYKASKRGRDFLATLYLISLEEPALKLYWFNRLRKNNVLSQSSPGFQKRMQNAFPPPFFRTFWDHCCPVHFVCIARRGAENWLGSRDETIGCCPIERVAIICILILHICKKIANFWQKFC